VSVLGEGFRAVQRNLPALGIYLVFSVGISSSTLLGDHLVGLPLEEGAQVPPLLQLYGLGSDVLLALGMALGQVMAFSRIGMEIDRPLWKCSGDREALRRFFVLWLMLNLAQIASYRLLDWIHLASNGTQSLPMFLLVVMPVAILSTPMGACVMFFGRFQWSTLGKSLVPLVNEFPKTMVLVCFAGLMFFFAQFMILNVPQRWLWPVLDVVFGYFECVIFSAAWLICMINREAVGEGEDPYDF